MTNTSSSRRMALGYAMAIIASACYGLNPLFALPLYQEGLTPLSVLFYRYGFAVLMLAILMIVQGQSFRLSRRELLLTAVMGIMFGASSIFLFQSFTVMDAGLASTILFFYPLFVALISSVFLHEKLNWITWLCLALALIGVALLYRGEGGSTLSIVGIVLVMLSSLSYAFYLIGVNRSVLSQMNGVKLCFYASLFGLLLFFVMLRCGIDLQMPPSLLAWGCCIGSALFPTLISLVLITNSIHIIGSTPASIIGGLEPITALTITVLLFGSHLTIANVVGVVLILTSVTLIVVYGNRQKRNFHS